LWPLTNPVSTYLGDISYSLYLWHFPVVVLLVSLLASGTAGYYAVATVLILVLSIGSYHLVEDPIRRSSWLTGRGRARVWLPTWTRRRAAAFAGMAVIGVVLLAGSAALERHQVASAATGPKASSSTAYRCRGANQIGDPQCAGVALGNVVTPSRYAYADDVGDAFACWTYPGQPLHSCTYGSQRPGALRVALVGDSHAASLLPALTAAPRARQWSITTFVGDGCDWSTSSCPAISATQQRLLDDPKFDLIITTADRQFTGPDPVSDFTQLWQPVAARGTRIAVVADVPAVPASMLECVDRVTFSAHSTCSTPMRTAYAGADPLVAAAARVPGAHLVDLRRFFCTANRCPAVIGNEIVYRDTFGHLTSTYAESLGRFLVAQVLEATGLG
jgi:hypothetical protein